MPWGWVVTAILALHFGYLAYLVLGGFLAWRWPRTIWAHLVAAAWGLLIVSGRVDCPLTYAEGWARVQAGQTRPTQGFIDRYLDNVIYPDRYVNLVRLGVAIVVAISYGGVLVRRRRATRAASDAKSADADGRAATV